MKNLILAACLLVLTFSFVYAAGGAAPTTRSNAQAQSQPASAPATRPYPSPELTAACKKAASDLGDTLDKTFRFHVEPPFVVAGNMGEKDLKAYTDACVTKPSEAMWKAYFQKKPDKVITVLLFADDKSYRSWAEKLFGDKDVSHFGYYRPDVRTLVMNISTGGGTLIHELTHSLIVYDFPDVPQWFNEGLASLHEGCQVGDDDIVGLVNWRLPPLQKAIKDKKLRSLADMVTKDDFYGDLKGLNYAQSRYFFMYAQQQGLLKKFYPYYRDHHEGKQASVKAIEHIFGKKIDQVEKDYLAFVAGLKPQ